LTVVATVFGVAGVAAPAEAAARRPVPSITKVAVSKSTAYVSDRVGFVLTLTNVGSRASAPGPMEIRLSNNGRALGSTRILRSRIPHVSAKSRVTKAFVATIWTHIASGEYDVLACREAQGRMRCVNKAELRVTRRPAKVSLEPGSKVDFGRVAEGTSSASRRIVVRNVGQKPTGDVDVDIEGEDDDDFRITKTTCGKSLAPGAGCTVDLVFRPTDEGRLEAELEADPDDAKVVRAELTGIGRENDDDYEDGQDEVTGDDSPVVNCKSSANTGTAPASILNLTNWKLTLPVDGCDDDKWADEVTQPALAKFRDSRYFTVNSARGVVFRARVDGARTSENTKYPRSELREMTDRGERRASWSNKSSGDGVHRMTMTAAITAAPSSKPHVVAAQIHDASDDVMMIRLYGRQLVVDADDSNVRLLLDDDYQLGERFTVAITASNGHIRVVYNGSRSVDYKRSSSGMYFKAGCYTLSNTSYDRGDQFGEVVIYALSVSHA
jgi:poly(beta-D-mannuronate) lyase